VVDWKCVFEREIHRETEREKCSVCVCVFVCACVSSVAGTRDIVA